MITKSSSTKNIDKKIFAVQSAAPVIKKKADNPYFKSKYAEYPEIQADIRPLTIQQGLLVNFAPVVGDQLVMTIKDIETGEYYEVTADLKSGSATPQAQGSAITYLKRYMITAFFDLIIEDAMDDDGNSGSGNNKQPANNNTNPPAPPANLNWLNPNTKEWFTAKGGIFNKKKTIEDVRKQFKVNKANGELIVKKEDLKPGTAYWTFATEYLAKKDAKAINITNMFDISESDLQDLQIDATNYIAPVKEETKITNTTNEEK